MLAILKLLQSIVSTLHSAGSPRQVALGFALGASLGLTPLPNVHNGVVVLLLCVLNVSFGAGMLAWAVFTPVGFMLDPLFDRVGQALLLGTPALTPLWTSWYNAAGMPWTNFNNTVVLGSVVAWLVLFAPIALAARWGLVRYRARYAAAFEQSRWMKAVKASKLYNVWSWFSP
ncbi:MAG: TIGR03546 family protein [Gemmatimonadetes bacterium]|nr:TIGR03546 family protein [Gemmatimonadota bacterium]